MNATASSPESVFAYVVTPRGVLHPTTFRAVNGRPVGDDGQFLADDECTVSLFGLGTPYATAASYDDGAVLVPSQGASNAS